MKENNFTNDECEFNDNNINNYINSGKTNF